MSKTKRMANFVLERLSQAGGKAGISKVAGLLWSQRNFSWVLRRHHRAWPIIGAAPRPVGCANIAPLRGMQHRETHAYVHLRRIRHELKLDTRHRRPCSRSLRDDCLVP